MNRSLVSTLLLCVAGLTIAGCANVSPKPSTAYRSRGAPTIALAITVDGVLQPTPQQYAMIQAKAVREFGALGYVLVTDLSLAEQIVRINFTPNANDPENSGRATVLGFRSNPYYTYARNPINGRYPTSFGYAGSFTNGSWSSLNEFGHGYYGYGNSYYDGYSYSSPTLNPLRPISPVTPSKPVQPPFRHDSAYCPPEQSRIRPIEGTFATAFTPVTPADYPRTPSRDGGRWRSGGEGSDSRTSYASHSSSGSTGSQPSSRTSWRSREGATDSSSRGNWRDRSADSSSSISSERSFWSSRSSDSGTHPRSDSSSYSRVEPISSSSGYSFSAPSSSSSSSYSAPSYSSSSSSSIGSAFSSSSSDSSSSSSSSSSSPTVSDSSSNSNQHQH